MKIARVKTAQFTRMSLIIPAMVRAYDVSGQRSNRGNVEKVEGQAAVRGKVGGGMVDVIRSFEYKTAGRGKGVLGLKDLQPRSRRPGETTAGGANSAEKPSAGAGRSTTGSASSKSEERDSKRSGGECV